MSPVGAASVEAQATPGAQATSEEMEEVWFDSHCHLQDAYLLGERVADPALRASEEPGEPDRAEAEAVLVATLERAALAGVRRAVCVGTGPETSKAALSLAERSHEGAFEKVGVELFATVGLHPHDASLGSEETLALLDRAAAAKGAPRSGGRLVGVGECGLDYHYEHSPRDVQRRVFAEQVAAANRLDLALVIHAREAWDDLFSVLEAEGTPPRTVLHCFTGGPSEARRCLDAGMYLSFSGIVTFKNAGEVREAAALCPLDRLLVETDSPFLTPAPHRGTPNEPAYVALVGRAVAAVKGVSPGALSRSTRAATAALFSL